MPPPADKHNTPPPPHARIVIIGGGVMGCSLAYHLCKAGETDVLLLEKHELTSGSTWHAAGQITHSVSHYALAKMAAYGTQLYPQLEAETGQACGWHGCGSLRVAYTDAEVDWLRHTMSIGQGLGHAMELISPARMRELHPFYQTDGVKVALHTPQDGHTDPAGVTFALAKGARQLGARVVTHNRVTGLQQRADEFIVQTERGEVRAEIVVNAGGVYARQIGAYLGLNLPIANLLHHYLVSESIDELKNLERELPVVRDDRMVSGYVRMEQQALLVGIYEKTNAKTVWEDGAPWSAANELFAADYERIMPWLENAMHRVPLFAGAGIKSVVHGAITHPPDGNMLLGPTEIRNFWLCCGAQVGIAWAPGAGKYLAQWMLHGAADISMRSFDPLRFGARLDDAYRLQKAREDYCLRHEIPFPNLDRPACRPSHSKCSPLYAKLQKRGAVYEDIYGWERPAWYAPRDATPAEIDAWRHSFRRTRLHDIIGDEVAHLRAHAGVADLSAFAKLELSGKDADAFLARVSANRLPQTVGAIRLTYLINANGRVEADATLTKLGDRHYYLVYAAAREAALLHWLKRELRAREQVAIKNVSDDYGVLMLAGPNAREVLGGCSDASLSNQDFPWLRMREIQIGEAKNVRAMRVTYSGELGWELHAPMQHMQNLYRAVCDAARDELAHVGSFALNAMRMEKAYLSGHEITPEVTLNELGAGKNFAANDFQGAAESLAESARYALAYLQLDRDANADPQGGEAVRHAGEVVGRLSSGGYGRHIDAPLAFAFVAPGLQAAGTTLEVEVQGSLRNAVALGAPVYDAANVLVRG